MRPDYDDAMAYLNLMYRKRAELECDNPDARKADLKMADDWVDKTMATKKAKAEKAGPSGIVTTETQPVSCRSEAKSLERPSARRGICLRIADVLPGFRPSSHTPVTLPPTCLPLDAVQSTLLWSVRVSFPLPPSAPAECSITLNS